MNQCPKCKGEVVHFCRKDLKYFFSRIDWGKSFLDADAVKIMNGEKGVVCCNSEIKKNGNNN